MPRYKSEDLIEFATDVLVKIGFPKKQAKAAAFVFVEADLRGDMAHGLIGGSSIDDILIKVSDNPKELGFRRIEIADYSIDKQKYPTILTIDANGTLGHYVVLDIIPKVIQIAKKYGFCKAYVRNSTHFGDCGVYSEIIANEGLASRVTTTSPPWTKSFIELQEENINSIKNKSRYKGVRKRLGTNPIAWSIPYNRGIVTIDMAVTQRAVSPAIEVARKNTEILGITQEDGGKFYIGTGNKRRELTEKLHLRLSILNKEDLLKELVLLGYSKNIEIKISEPGLLKGPNGEDINFPLVFDSTFKKYFWIAPLGGTYFGYKGYGLNMLIELDNVVGGGNTGIIRQLDKHGCPISSERVSHTIEAYALDVLPFGNVFEKLAQSVKTTKESGNKYLLLPGQKEQRSKELNLKKGIFYDSVQVNKLKKLGEKVGVPFDLAPLR